ncbi:mitochondrial import inner membrane translocase subunit TIM8 [Microdochium trichocladiopsis]|uniref:Mitochondrial import inner membrane translocase subunit n=1 Tax=Microdochium trichocladiopsis TaxID=1682393 RepID=A0A9P8YEH7_9PEZI|nr:mitochondrial import inner membrane translocase subunit TIM8 [Microdochium trichocladiopsis]KAH7037759.1 mitochondrial import inner membrane translocase subunit TIM8 [Microdochium trichocladiopsis]
MDGTTINDADLQRLNEKDKSELRTILNNEAQKSRVQSTVHSLTDVCFTKCITGTIKSGKLDRTEESCMANCAERFLDASKLTMSHLQGMRN